MRGKILNVANASSAKLSQNQLISDLILALGAGTGSKYRDEDLRYERVIIMTDADVDGAHIASLLITFFYQEMPELIENGHLFLAVPPLYRLTWKGDVEYARDDAHRERLLGDQVCRQEARRDALQRPRRNGLQGSQVDDDGSRRSACCSRSRSAMATAPASRTPSMH